MRNQFLMLAAMFIGGCAEQPSERPMVTPVTLSHPAGCSSAALAFDAPITLYQPYVDISRDDRGPAALVGYEEASTSTYDIISDNRLATDHSNLFVRESITERTGATHR